MDMGVPEDMWIPHLMATKNVVNDDNPWALGTAKRLCFRDTGPRHMQIYRATFWGEMVSSA